MKHCAKGNYKLEHQDQRPFLWHALRHVFILEQQSLLPYFCSSSLWCRYLHQEFLHLNDGPHDNNDDHVARFLTDFIAAFPLGVLFSCCILGLRFGILKSQMKTRIPKTVLRMKTKSSLQLLKFCTSILRLFF